MKKDAEWWRNYRATKRNTGCATPATSGATEVQPPPDNATVVQPNGFDISWMTAEFKALQVQIDKLSQRLDRIEAVQAKAVTLGVSVPRKTEKYANPFSKESQAHGHMPDNSPLGWMFRGEA